jgi:hypothetical protein
MRLKSHYQENHNMNIAYEAIQSHYQENHDRPSRGGADGGRGLGEGWGNKWM